MKSRLILSLILLVAYSISISGQGQTNHKDHRVFLLGNLDELAPNAPEFSALENAISMKSTPYSIIVNGNFVGKTGWSSNPKPQEKALIDKLINLASEPGGNIIFVPGKNEWDNGGLKGAKKVKALEKYIESQLGKGKSFFPQKGCLGPEVTDISDHVRVVTINSQWLMQERRPDEEDATCSFTSDRELWDELGSVLSDADNRNIIVAIHHPVLSYGQFAGYKLGGMHFAPPIIGTFRVAHRRHVAQEALKSFRNKLLLLSREHENIIFTSGQEYDLQVLSQDGNYHINSGALAKSKPVAKKEATLFSKNAKGVAQLNFLGNGEVNVDILELQKDKLTKIFNKKLFSSPCLPSNEASVRSNPFFNPCPKTQIIVGETPPNLSQRGSGKASTAYDLGKSGEFWLGKLYRDEWSAQVNNIPYLDIGTVEGGLTPYARGGAGETTSLKFKTKDGRKYAFRSIDKNPQRKLEEDVLNSAIGKLSKDLTAHQHPYGAIVAKTFLDELDLPHSDPVLYIMPDDPRIGQYQKEFAGMLGTFELKPWNNKKDRIGFENADEVSSTFEVYRELLDDPNSKVEPLPYLRARLFDIWMADWDRHEDNWAWLGYEEDQGMTYKVFPKDKDKVFAILKGLYAAIDWEWISPTMASFREDYRGLKSLNFKSRNMDRWLLAEVTKEEWMKEAENLKTIMTDEVLDRALANMPVEVQEISGSEIKRVFKIRRDLLPQAIDEYYELLAKYAFVVGTNEKEAFDIVRMKNGDVQISVSELLKDGMKSPVLFNRTFKKSETKEIRIYGLGKDDQFSISGTADKAIVLRIIGGHGEDIVEDKANVKGGKSTFIYDYRNNDNLTLGSEAKKVKTNREMIFNSQDLFNYDYAVTLPKLGYNSDDGFIAGVNYTNVKQGFGRKDFSSKAAFGGTITTGGNFNIDYKRTVRRANSTWDVIYGVEAANNDRAYQRFFGLGNDTSFDPALKLNGYYRNKTRKYVGFLGFEKKFWGRSYFSPSVRIEYNNVRPRPKGENTETIYDALPTSIGLGKMTIAGPFLELDIDLTDNEFLPTHGVKFKMSNYSFFNNSEELGFGGRFETEGAVYLSAGKAKPITLSFRGGYSISYGDTPFYYKSTIGQPGNNRGFSRNRFIGDSAAFLNTDLRLHIASIQTPLVPIKFGILGLYDIGRVWVENEDSTTWHKAWGGGFYIVPWQDQFSLSFTYAKSKEQSIISYGLGLYLN